MSWKDKLQSQLAGQNPEQALAEHWPKVQELFREKVGPAALRAAQNDEQVTSLLRLVYDSLPFPVRPLVKEEVFLRYCLSHRDKLLPPES